MIPEYAALSVTPIYESHQIPVDLIHSIQPWRMNLVASNAEFLFLAVIRDVLCFRLSGNSSLNRPTKSYQVLKGWQVQEGEGYVPNHLQPPINYMKIGNLGFEEVLVAVCDDGEVIVWFTNDLNRTPLRFSNEVSTWGATTHGPSYLLAVSANSHQIAVWDLRSDLRHAESSLATIEVSDGDNMTIDPLGNGIHKRILQGHQHNIPCIDISDCGKWLVSTSIDSTVRIWYLPTGRTMYNIIPSQQWGWHANFFPLPSFKHVSMEFVKYKNPFAISNKDGGLEYKGSGGLDNLWRWFLDQSSDTVENGIQLGEQELRSRFRSFLRDFFHVEGDEPDTEEEGNQEEYEAVSAGNDESSESSHEDVHSHREDEMELTTEESGSRAEVIAESESLSRFEGVQNSSNAAVARTPSPPPLPPQSTSHNPSSTSTPETVYVVEEYDLDDGDGLDDLSNEFYDADSDFDSGPTDGLLQQSSVPEAILTPIDDTSSVQGNQQVSSFESVIAPSQIQSRPTSLPPPVVAATKTDAYLCIPNFENLEVTSRIRDIVNRADSRVELQHFNRLCMMCKLEEFGAMLIGSQKGKVAVVRVIRICSSEAKKPDRYILHTESYLGPSTDNPPSFSSSSTTSRAPSLPRYPLAGITATKFPAHVAPSQKPKPNLETTKEKQPLMSGSEETFYRVHLVYMDGTVMCYEIRRNLGGGLDIDDVVL